MDKNRSIEELTAIWLSLDNDEDRHRFINGETTAREVYRLDRSGLLEWSKVVTD